MGKISKKLSVRCRKRSFTDKRTSDHRIRMRTACAVWGKTDNRSFLLPPPDASSRHFNSACCHGQVGVLPQRPGPQTSGSESLSNPMSSLNYVNRQEKLTHKFGPDFRDNSKVMNYSKPFAKSEPGSTSKLRSSGMAFTNSASEATPKPKSTGIVFTNSGPEATPKP